MCLKTPESVQVFDVSVVCPSAGSHLCPRSLDCARAGRHFCQQGSSHCGPCLRPLVENSHGRCVIKRRHLSHSTQSAKGHQYENNCFYRLQKSVRLTQKVDYPAYGLMRPGDKKLAHSAQMYHYQHQKQQMLSLEKHREGPKVPDSGASTDEENEDGDFTVYECPGLAPVSNLSSVPSVPKTHYFSHLICMIRADLDLQK
uniref:Neural proliferation, differentiation and control, 1b n=1 Tax=Sphaeramia orbicularis TaxID=375764 RepID=A0A672YKR2_9TELE